MENSTPQLQPQTSQRAPAEELFIHRPGVLRPVSWGALFGGLMVSLAFQLVLDLLAIGVGLSFVSGGQGAGSAANAGSIGLGAGLWWGIVYLISIFIGGLFAARLSGMAGRLDGTLHGLITWAFTLLVMFYLVTTSVGAVLGGVFGVVGKAISTTGTVLKPVEAKIATVSGGSGDLGKQAQALLNPPGQTKMNPQQAQKQIAEDLREYVAGGQNAGQARDRIVALISSQLGISHQQASQRFDQWRAEFNKTKAAANETAHEAAHAVSWAAIWTFVALALGALVGALGGALGTRRYVAEASR